MATTPGMPEYWAHKIDRVRNDGNWITGDPANMDYLPWRIDGRTVMGVPRLLLDRWVDAPHPPTIPGWQYQNYSGFHSTYKTATQPAYLVCCEYTPIECNDPAAPPKQLTLF